MRKIYTLIFLIFFVCGSKHDYKKEVEDFFKIREKAYANLDVDLMMSTYHPDFKDRGMDYRAKKAFYEKIFEKGNEYKFSVRNIRVAERNGLIYVRYDYKLDKNLSNNLRGFSQNMHDEVVILKEYKGKLVEYGRQN